MNWEHQKRRAGVTVQTQLERVTGKSTESPTVSVNCLLCLLLPLPSRPPGNYRIKEITGTSTFGSSDHMLAKYEQQGKGSYLDYSQGKLIEAEVSGQEQIRSDLARTTSSCSEAPVLRRLTSTHASGTPSNGIHNSFPSMFLLLLPKFRFKFQTVSFVTIITTKIPARAPPSTHVVCVFLSPAAGLVPRKPEDPHCNSSLSRLNN